MSDNPELNPAIDCFTLRELYAMTKGERAEGLLAECLAATSESHLEAFLHPCRIDAFIIGIGTEGKSRVSFNLCTHELEKDTLFIYAPRNIIQVETNHGFKAHVLAVSPEFLKRINIDIKHMMPLFLRFAAHPCLKLSPEQSQMLRSFISLIEQETQTTESPLTQEIVSGLISATIYKVGEILHHYLAERPELQSALRSRNEEYFRQFMALLGEHYRTERNVGFYARQLCITPKYLTTLMKRISEKSASEWIDSFVILEAKTLLKYSSMSVQEVAYRLNFPNQSFFGSYFKRNTGMSPSQFKATD